MQYIGMENYKTIYKYIQLLLWIVSWTISISLGCDADGVAVELSVLKTGLCKHIKLNSISFQVTPFFPIIIVIAYEGHKLSYKSIDIRI